MDPAGHAHDEGALGATATTWGRAWNRLKSALGRKPDASVGQADIQMSTLYRMPGDTDAAVGDWTEGDWYNYLDLKDAVGSDLLAQHGQAGGGDMAFLDRIGAALGDAQGRAAAPFYDATRLVVGGLVPSAATAWVWGNTILWDAGQGWDKAVMNHEYVHVLQYRRDGVGFLASYGVQDAVLNVYNARARQRGATQLDAYEGGIDYETQGRRVQRIYERPSGVYLPYLWNLP